MLATGRKYLLLLVLFGLSSAALAAYDIDSLYFYGAGGTSDASIQPNEVITVHAVTSGGTATDVNDFWFQTYNNDTADGHPTSGDEQDWIQRVSTVSNFSWNAGTSTATFNVTAPTSWGASDQDFTIYCKLSPTSPPADRINDAETYLSNWGASSVITDDPGSVGHLYGDCETDSTPPSLTTGDGDTEATSLTTIRLMFDEPVQETGGDCGDRFSASGDGITGSIAGTSLVSVSSTEWTLTLASSLPDRDWTGTITYDATSGNDLEDLSGNEISDGHNVTASTEAIAPDTPTMNTPTLTSNFESGTVDWTASADNSTSDPSIASLQLQGSADNNTWNDIGSVDSNTSDTNYSGSYTPGTEYAWFRIKALDDQGNVAYSSSRGDYTDYHHLWFTTSEVNEPVNDYEDEINISVHDAYGTPLSGESWTVNLAMTSGTGTGTFRETPGGSNVTSVSISSADTSASFYYACTQPGTKIITASANLLVAASQTATINAGVASKLLVKLPGQTFSNGTGITGTADDQTAGSSFNINLYVVDSNNYVVASEDASRDIDFACTADASPSGSDPTISGQTSTSWDNISISFTDGISADIACVFYEAERDSITATDNSGSPTLTGTASSGVDVGHSPSHHYVFSIASGSSESGVAWTGTNTLTIQDQYNNTATGFSAASNNVTVSSSNGTISGLGSGENSVLDQAGDFTSGVCDLTSQGIILTAAEGTHTISASFASSLPGEGSSTDGSKQITVNAPTMSNPNYDNDVHIAITGSETITLVCDVSSGEDGETLKVHWAWDNDGTKTSGYAAGDSADVTVASDQITKYLNDSTLNNGAAYDYMFWWVSGQDSQGNDAAGTPIAATRARMLVNPTLTMTATDQGTNMNSGTTQNPLTSISLSMEMDGTVAIQISSLQFTKTSTSSATATDISKFQLWHDANHSNTVDGGDVQLGSDVSGTVNPNFTGLSFDASYGSTHYLLLTVDIANTPDLNHTLGMQVDNSGDVSLAYAADDISGSFPMPGTPGDYTLPVNFSSFMVAADNGLNRLIWVTESEQDNAGFNVWRATGSSVESLPALSQFQLVSGWENNESLVGQGNTAQPTTYTFEDTNITPGRIYFYQLQTIDLAGHSEFHTEWVSVESMSIPTRLTLHPNYPNPFNPSTHIDFDLPEASRVQLQIFNIQGQLVNTLIPETDYPWGHYEMVWDGTNRSGQYVASGIYIYQLQAGEQLLRRRMTLLR